MDDIAIPRSGESDTETGADGVNEPVPPHLLRRFRRFLAFLRGSVTRLPTRRPCSSAFSSETKTRQLE